MSYQTISVSSILRTWRDKLHTDEDLENWCRDRYRKPLQIFVGLDGKHPPTGVNCPCIILFPGTKVEGLEEGQYSYFLSIGWSVENQEISCSKGVTEYQGLYDCDDLGQMLWGIVQGASPDNPCSRVSYDINSTDFFPQFPGRMDIRIDVTPSIGGVMGY